VRALTVERHFLQGLNIIAPKLPPFTSLLQQIDECPERETVITDFKQLASFFEDTERDSPFGIVSSLENLSLSCYEIGIIRNPEFKESTQVDESFVR
jgi:hypothetical protein